MQALLDKPAPAAPTYAGQDPVNHVDPTGRASWRALAQKFLDLNQLNYCAQVYRAKCATILYSTGKTIQVTARYMKVSESEALGANSGRIDAFRHTLWTAMMARNLDNWIFTDVSSAYWGAWNMAENHERWCVYKCGRTGDRHNNNYGLGIYLSELYRTNNNVRRVSGTKLARATKTALNSGALNTTSN